MSTLRLQLCDYLWDEVAQVQSIFRQHPMTAVFEEMDSILKSADPEVISRVLSFIRDASLYEHSFRGSFRLHLGGSATIGETLSKLLLVLNFRVRSATIFTIGKVGIKDRAYLLADAFPFYLENDPLNLPRLLGEHAWLNGGYNWNFITAVATAKHFLTRWSLCDVLACDCSPEDPKKSFFDTLTQLKGDPHPLVAAESNWHLEKLTVKLRPKLPKPEWRKEVKRIAALEPHITFQNAGIRFHNNLNENNRADYALEEFKRFVAGLTPN